MSDYKIKVGDVVKVTSPRPFRHHHLLGLVTFDTIPYGTVFTVSEIDAHGDLEEEDEGLRCVRSQDVTLVSALPPAAAPAFSESTLRAAAIATGQDIDRLLRVAAAIEAAN